VDLKEILDLYENFHREGNKTLIDEKRVAGNLEGLDEFVRLLALAKRNKDVMGALVRGIKGARPLSGFRFVEQDVTPKVKKVKPTITGPREESVWASQGIQDPIDIEGRD
jgi:hypothetical protein